MAGNKKKEYVEFHLRYYPEKYEAHANLLGLLRSYQKSTGLGIRDAFAMMVFSETKNIADMNFNAGEWQQRKEHEKKDGAGKEPAASMTLRHGDGNHESGGTAPKQKTAKKEAIGGKKEPVEKIQSKQDKSSESGMNLEMMETFLTDNYEDLLGEEL